MVLKRLGISFKKTYTIFSDKHERHNNSKDSDGFTENNGDQILCSYPGRFYTTTENGRTGRENTPKHIQ